MSLGWDPADYGGAQTFVGAIYSYELDLAGYVTVQEIKKPLISQLDPELQPLGLKGKLIRTESWNELRALSHALSHVGFGLDDIRGASALESTQAPFGACSTNTLPPHNIVVGMS